MWLDIYKIYIVELKYLGNLQKINQQRNESEKKIKTRRKYITGKNEINIFNLFSSRAFDIVSICEKLYKYKRN